MSNTNLKTKAAPIWGASACTREQFGIAPFSPLQGSGLPFAGYAATGMTLAAVRHDDPRVPDPRERKR